MCSANAAIVILLKMVEDNGKGDVPIPLAPFFRLTLDQLQQQYVTSD
jgi:hypothetical protein